MLKSFMYLLLHPRKCTYFTQKRKKKISFASTLAEGATHVDMLENTRKSAFTLAEVLITLGIIGVVAAITMPTLIGNYQKHVWVNQLKKTVSVVENGFRMAMANDGVEALENTELFSDFEPDKNPSQEDTINFSEKLKAYINILKYDLLGFDEYEGYKYLNKEDATGNGDYYCNKYYLSDGSVVLIQNSCPRVSFNRYGDKDIATIDIYIDVNGEKGPNILGRDYFTYELLPNGQLRADFDNDCNTDGEGYGCSGYLVQNNYKMDY